MQAAKKPTPQKGRQGQLSFRSSQEDRKGALSLSLSQLADSKAAPKKQNQSTLQFQPISREEAALLASSQAQRTTDEASRSSFRGYGSSSQEQRASKPAGMNVAAVAAVARYRYYRCCENQHSEAAEVSCHIAYSTRPQSMMWTPHDTETRPPPSLGNEMGMSSLQRISMDELQGMCLTPHRIAALLARQRRRWQVNQMHIITCDSMPADKQSGWHARHVPETVDTLAMHKKKIEEICGWLELQKEPGLLCHAPRMLILSGKLSWNTRCTQAEVCLYVRCVVTIDVMEHMLCTCSVLFVMLHRNGTLVVIECKRVTQSGLYMMLCSLSDILHL